MSYEFFNDKKYNYLHYNICVSYYKTCVFIDEILKKRKKKEKKKAKKEERKENDTVGVIKKLNETKTNGKISRISKIVE